MPDEDATRVPTIVSQCKTQQAAETHPLMETKTSSSAPPPLPQPRPTPGRSLHCRKCPHSYEPPCGARYGALVQTLERLRAECAAGAATGAGSSRAWKLFILAPRIGAHGAARFTGHRGAVGTGGFPTQRMGCCSPHAGCATRRATPRPSIPSKCACERKRHQACAKVQRGEISSAPGVFTWAALTDPGVASALRSARRGGALGLSGMRAEHLKLLLVDINATELLIEAATQLARAHVPADVPPALAMARLTALRKPDGGVLGMATGDVFRRLVSKTPARQWATTFDLENTPIPIRIASPSWH